MHIDDPQLKLKIRFSTKNFFVALSPDDDDGDDDRKTVKSSVAFLEFFLKEKSQAASLRPRPTSHANITSSIRGTFSHTIDRDIIWHKKKKRHFSPEKMLFWKRTHFITRSVD